MEHNRQSKKRSHRRRPSGTSTRHHASFLRRFWFEILALILFGIGVFLLLERLQIKSIAYRALVSSYRATAELFSNVANGATAALERVERSDLVGVVLIVVAIVMLVLGLRRRAIRRSLPLLEGAPCPECGEVLERVRRTLAQRLLQTLFVIRIRPYACRKCSFRATVWSTRYDV